MDGHRFVERTLKHTLSTQPLHIFYTLLFSCNTGDNGAPHWLISFKLTFHCPLITNCTHFLFVTEINQSLPSENKGLRKTLSDQPGEKKLDSRAVSGGAKLIATYNSR